MATHKPNRDQVKPLALLLLLLLLFYPINTMSHVCVFILAFLYYMNYIAKIRMKRVLQSALEKRMESKLNQGMGEQIKHCKTENTSK